MAFYVFSRAQCSERTDDGTRRVHTADMNKLTDDSAKPVQQQLYRYAQIAALVVVVVGCYLVLHPFIPAILFAAVVCSASWPLYAWLRKKLWGNATLAALLMSALLVVLVIAPSLLLAASLSDNVIAFADTIKSTLEHGPGTPPDWLARVPLVA